MWYRIHAAVSNIVVSAVSAAPLGSSLYFAFLASRRVASSRSVVSTLRAAMRTYRTTEPRMKTFLTASWGVRCGEKVEEERGGKVGQGEESREERGRARRKRVKVRRIQGCSQDDHSPHTHEMGVLLGVLDADAV